MSTITSYKLLGVSRLTIHRSSLIPLVILLHLCQLKKNALEWIVQRSVWRICSPVVERCFSLGRRHPKGLDNGWAGCCALRLLLPSWSWCRLVVASPIYEQSNLLVVRTRVAADLRASRPDKIASYADYKATISVTKFFCWTAPNENSNWSFVIMVLPPLQSLSEYLLVLEYKCRKRQIDPRVTCCK